MARYVLYGSQQEHTADCQKYPLQQIPRFTMLDTNVVECLVRFSECVCEQAVIPEHVDETRRRDVEALMHVFLVSSRSHWSWDFCISPKTIEEIEATTDVDLRSELLDYGITFAPSGGDRRIAREDVRYGSDLARRLADRSLFAALPDREDRIILAHALAYGCDAFCTRDRRTIVKRREMLPKLPLRILTPEEWWHQIKPWAGLWC